MHSSYLSKMMNLMKLLALCLLLTATTTEALPEEWTETLCKSECLHEFCPEGLSNGDLSVYVVANVQSDNLIYHFTHMNFKRDLICYLSGFNELFENKPEMPEELKKIYEKENSSFKDDVCGIFLGRENVNCLRERLQGHVNNFNYYLQEVMDVDQAAYVLVNSSNSNSITEIEDGDLTDFTSINRRQLQFGATSLLVKPTVFGFGSNRALSVGRKQMSKKVVTHISSALYPDAEGGRKLFYEHAKNQIKKLSSGAISPLPLISSLEKKIGKEDPRDEAMAKKLAKREGPLTWLAESLYSEIVQKRNTAINKIREHTIGYFDSRNFLYDPNENSLVPYSIMSNRDITNYLIPDEDETAEHENDKILNQEIFYTFEEICFNPETSGVIDSMKIRDGATCIRSICKYEQQDGIHGKDSVLLKKYHMPKKFLQSNKYNENDPPIKIKPFRQVDLIEKDTFKPAIFTSDGRSRTYSLRTTSRIPISKAVISDGEDGNIQHTVGQWLTDQWIYASDRNNEKDNIPSPIWDDLPEQCFTISKGYSWQNKLGMNIFDFDRDLTVKFKYQKINDIENDEAVKAIQQRYPSILDGYYNPLSKMLNSQSLDELDVVEKEDGLEFDYDAAVVDDNFSETNPREEHQDDRFYNPKRKFFVGGNWQSYGVKDSIEDMVMGVLVGNEDRVAVTNMLDIVVFPPTIYINYVQDLFFQAFGYPDAEDGNFRKSPFQIGSQNVGRRDCMGPYTGEVCASMLADNDVGWVVLGTSEQRHPYGEMFSGDDDLVISEKIARSLENGIKVVVCVGDTEKEREDLVTLDVVEAQLVMMLDSVDDPEDFKNLVIAYEPQWLEGKQMSYTNAEMVQIISRHMREVIAELKGEDVAKDIRIVYSGDVGSQNAEALINQKDIDGFLMGESSLDGGFINVIEEVNPYKHK